MIWDILIESHSELEDVLRIENEVRSRFRSDKQFCYEERQNNYARTPCEAFSRAYHEAMNGMVEGRMQNAVKRVSDFWYSAWVDAGQTPLDELDK